MLACNGDPILSQISGEEPSIRESKGTTLKQTRPSQSGAGARSFEGTHGLVSSARCSQVLGIPLRWVLVGEGVMGFGI